MASTFFPHHYVMKVFSLILPAYSMRWLAGCREFHTLDGKRFSVCTSAMLSGCGDIMRRVQDGDVLDCFLEQVGGA